MNNESVLSVVSKPARMLGRVFAISSVMLLMACNASNSSSSQDQSSSEESSSSSVSSSVSSVSSSSSSSSEPNNEGNPGVGAMLWESTNLNGNTVFNSCSGCHMPADFSGMSSDFLVTVIRDTMPYLNGSACNEQCARDIVAWLETQ